MSLLDPQMAILLDDDVEETSPSTAIMRQTLIHNCLVHPAVGVLRVIAQALRMKQRTKKLGKAMEGLAEAVHDL